MDVPADVESVLTQLFGEAQGAFEDGDGETGVAALTSARAVATNKLPESRLRAQLLHGCERALAAADDEESGVAAEYAASMERRLAGAADG